MRPTTIYDGGCGICIRFKAFVAGLDHGDRITWVDLRDADYAALPVDEDACLNAMQVIDDGRVYRGFYAVRHICRRVPFLVPVALFLSIPGLPFIGERAYRYVATHRHCTV